MGPGLQKGHQGSLGGLSGLRGGYPGQTFKGSESLGDLFLDSGQHCGFLTPRGKRANLRDLIGGVVSECSVVQEGQAYLDVRHAACHGTRNEVCVFYGVTQGLTDGGYSHQADHDERHKEHPSGELVGEQDRHAGSIGTLAPETHFSLGIVLG
mgnify:CR=1 FL=1